MLFCFNNLVSKVKIFFRLKNLVSKVKICSIIKISYKNLCFKTEILFCFKNLVSFQKSHFVFKNLKVQKFDLLSKLQFRSVSKISFYKKAPVLFIYKFKSYFIKTECTRNLKTVENDNSESRSILPLAWRVGDHS